MSRTPLLFTALLGVVASLGACDDGGSSASPPGERTYVGAESCADCHPRETEAWRGSHHDLAMQEATADTVLGDFTAADYEFDGERTSFATRDGRFFVTTPGPDGERTEYEVLYTFGVTPLQQYLVAFPGGRFQALSVAWDSRPEGAGGQRWFRLLPDEHVPAGDSLHWTSPLANWNQQCSDCHSTQLEKRYDRETKSYATRWEALDVSCEACHGPASHHVAVAYSGGGFDPNFGFAQRLTGAGGWIMDAGPNARRLGGPDPAIQVQTCAPCHSRRGEIVDAAEPGAPLLDGYQPSLLDEALYHADGQIQDEVYVWWSFLQSRMHAAGVVCSDCHDPHGLNLIYEGNDLCTRCHDREVYDVPDHHHHEVGTAGASCVECHMPATTYMVVDPRRDHSLRVPRPDLSIETGAPNACTACHDDRTAQWAAEAVDEWTGGKRPPHRGQAFHAFRSSAVDGERRLAEVIRDPLQPAIVRATALAEQGARFGPRTGDLVALGLADESDLVVLGALRAADLLDPARRIALAGKHLAHPRRAVRIEAARALSPLVAQLDDALRPAYDAAHAERLAFLETNADQPWALNSLAMIRLAEGDADAAEALFREAIEVGPWYVEPYGNYADLLRTLDRDAEGEAVLREGLGLVSDPGPLHHALGLNLVRQERLLEAQTHLGMAAELRPDVARFAHYEALSLHSYGRTEAAVIVLERALETHASDRDLLNTQVSLLLELGREDEARVLVARLLELDPENQEARAFLEGRR